MENLKSINIYYQKIIDAILQQHQNDFENAIPGHCMKITGLGLNELEHLWEILQKRFPNLETYIVSAETLEDKKFISATKLIELRNGLGAPLLVLIPSNNRTAAEDSYGNATFKEISLDGIELKLKNDLLNNIPHENAHLIKNEILNYLNLGEAGVVNVINYLLALQENGYSKENIGNYIFLLNLIPDVQLISESEKVRSRLNFNLESIELLSSFSKPVYDRITELPLASDTLQKELVNFCKKENEVKNAAEICKLIFEKYNNLNFAYWQIPDLDFSHIKLFVDEIKSNEFKDEDGKRVLHIEENKTAKVRVRFSTNPNPKDISDLKFFKIALMQVDGGSGQMISILRKLKNTASTSSYRDATIELNSNIIEEGSYFFKVLAEDEHGNVLNADDDFKDPKVDKAWKSAKSVNDAVSKSDFPYKLSCDSEDFDYVVDEVIEREDNQRKNKLNNVLQAHIRYRIEKLKSSETEKISVPVENSNIWLNDLTKHTSTFFINFSERHNYQINLSSKLRELENKFLENSSQLGYLRGTLRMNSAAIGYDSLKFVESELMDIIPASIMDLRKTIFDGIKNSNPEQNGVFETANIFEYKTAVRDYIQQLADWTKDLGNQVAGNELNAEEKSRMQHFLTELQILDIAKIKTKLPDGQRAEALLLSPLHPLRLSWSLSLIEVYLDWEKKTENYAGYKDAWSKNLEYLFEGELFPENNPLVLVDPSTFKSFHYSGELSYGWGLYLNVLTDEAKNGMTSVARQLKYYFRQLFNITKDNYVETDISQKLVVRHIKNYIAQHPYTQKLIINLINAGDSAVFADAFVELERETSFKEIKYEVRIFKGNDKIIEHGEALKNLINPESNVSEEAEAFSQPSKNRLFPKLRFSINNISDYLTFPFRFTAHLSFVISPFPVTVELIKPHQEEINFYLNGLLTQSSVVVDEETETKWSRFIKGNHLSIPYEGAGNSGIRLFNNIQSFIAGALASGHTLSIPSTQLRLNDKDKVLLTHLHDYSDWVITFDKNLGPQIFDKPSNDGKIPFLLDYIPGEELSGIASYLTTRPNSEILGLLGPHFTDFGLDIHEEADEQKIKIILEDIRAVSSSLVLQLNSSKNKAFEVIGTAFTKRVLEKKGFLSEAFLIPIDLHSNLFDGLQMESKSRADNLLVSIDLEKRVLNVFVIEIKCRNFLGETEQAELKLKIKEQIENTIEAIRRHFDPDYHLSFDRLDREIKNKELKSLLSFYIERAYRYQYLSENAFESYTAFLQTLDTGFKFEFKQLGLIFDFSATKKHAKEIDEDVTFFTFGKKLIDEILDPDSDLNTKRLEDKDFDEELSEAVGNSSALKPFIKRFKKTESQTETKGVSVPKQKMEKTAAEITAVIDPHLPDDMSGEISVDPPVESDPSPLPVPAMIAGEKSYEAPAYNLLIGKNSPSSQYGLLGESIHGKKIAIDLSETNTISLFGIQGGGKSYTIGTISEMVLKQFNEINELPSPLAGVIFHYSESMDYEPEFTSMILPNDNKSEIAKLKERYGAEPDSIDDVIILTPKDKLEERRHEFPSIEVLPIAFNSKELNVQDWLFILGAVGNDSTYIKQLKAIMKEHRRDLNLESLTDSVEASELLSNSQKALARQKLSFAREYVDDSFMLRDTLKPGRLIIVDLRDEFIVKDEALGLFVIMLNIFSAVKNVGGNHFNKFIVFDEAHKYMDNKDLTGNIVTAIREMRHKGVSVMIASQDPPSLPNEIIELSSIVLLHKFNSPQWLKHIQKSITQLSSLTAAEMSSLMPGEGFLWATKATERSISVKPVKISTRPRVTKHGGGTIQAHGNK